MTLCDVIFIAGGEHTSRLPHFSESIVLKHFEAAIGRGCAHGIGDLSFKCNVSKFLCFFVGFLAGKGWRGEWKALCLSFSGQTVSEPGQTYRQFQKFLLVIDSFGPNRCRKYVLKSLRILGQRKYTTSNSERKKNIFRIKYKTFICFAAWVHQWGPHLLTVYIMSN